MNAGRNAAGRPFPHSSAARAIASKAPASKSRSRNPRLIIKCVLVSDFDFHLPPELIAQHPTAERAASRLLHLRCNAQEFSHARSADAGIADVGLAEAGFAEAGFAEAGFADAGFRDSSAPDAAFFSQSIEDLRFLDFPGLLRPTDLLIFNDTKVLPARLFGRRSGQHAQPLSPANPASKDFLQGRIEVLLTRRLPGPEETWQALVRPGRKIMPGERLYFFEEAGAGGEETAEGAPCLPSVGRRGKQELRAGADGYAATDAAEPLLTAEVITRGEFGERTLRFLPVPDFHSRLERLGHIPLPPYIDRPDTAEDRQRYQTVFARDPGSVAAPTAGLHFTPEILAAIDARGIERATVTLHVGLGTFAPIRTDVVEEHQIHTESYSIPAETLEKIQRAKREGRRVVAIGTTTVRTLEYAAGGGGWQQQDKGEAEGAPFKPSVGLSGDVDLQPVGEANIFIYPGYRFRVVDAMLTNFHLPKSTLLMLVSAFAGREQTLAAYQHAVRERYRFFSYGDCMFIE